MRQNTNVFSLISYDSVIQPKKVSQFKLITAFNKNIMNKSSCSVQPCQSASRQQNSSFKFLTIKQNPIQTAAINIKKAISVLNHNNEVDYENEHLTGALQHSLWGAQLQYTYGFFHANVEQRLPVYGWSSKDISPYIEFSVSHLGKYIRLVYNVMNRHIYISEHYERHVRILNVPQVIINHLDEIATTNINYLIENEQQRGQNGRAAVEAYAQQIRVEIA